MQHTHITICESTIITINHPIRHVFCTIKKKVAIILYKPASI